MNTYLGEAKKALSNASQGAESNWPGPQPARLPHLPLQVDDLKAKLAVQEAELKQKNENADKLIHVVGVETEKVSKEKAIADEEEIKVEVINKNVTEKQKACETDLAKAEPALLAAQEALDTLNKSPLSSLPGHAIAWSPGPGAFTTSCCAHSYLDIIEQAISEGDTLLIENIGETIDPVLDPLLGRNTIKKGKYIKIGDKEVEYHPNFRLILQTKYFNPHYKPEMQAQNFVEEKMGSKFVEGRSVEFSKSYEESSPSTPIFFILSPGVDPLKDVEALGKKLGFTIDNGKLHNVSLGQGQEVVAENALDMAAENGHWVILQGRADGRIWGRGGHCGGACSGEERAGTEPWSWPQNIHLVARWLSTLDKKLERYSVGSHDDYRVFISAEPAPSPESHIIPQGILENAIKITNEPPTGMYANLHKALDLFTQDTLEMCTKEIEFKCILFALCYFHAVVAERRKFGAQGWNRSYPFNNGDLTISINVLYNYLEANPKVKAVLDEILEKIPETFNMAEIMAKAAEKTPYVVVAFQECERMNILTNEMRRSLKELNLGLKGELTITTDMEDLSTALFYDTVPDSWVARAYPSMMGLAAWYADLLLRIRELEAWTTDFALPTTVWLAGFFNPQSFLTAIMQSMARKNEWPLDKMCLSVEVTKKNREDMTAPPREGSYVYGLFMEGARWDTQLGVIAEARLKELTPAMPVIFIKAIPVDRMETKNIYECPVYKTRIRGPTYVWTFNLKTKEKAAKWILAAVALLLQV
ncbi:hypothetical protein Celaphus_00001574 [Cervus elaphus hippelaphus]|uniref:Uncharacterized protein n=1 Tax=Cervus elaphus hippelaphus TaxID=46360 RepID=A0A212D833_CEREH|nr:hypothetical protein Celaphus_00001574 [Cervus elaphus hippelaphus]